MNLLRSIMFNLHFYMLTILLIIFMFPTLFLPFKYFKIVSKLWTIILINGMKIWLGLDVRIKGSFNHKKTYIVAMKHQSAWETIISTSIFEMPSIVLKKELIYLPLIGLYFLKGKAIPIIRSNTFEALKLIIKKAKRSVNEGSSILIFPQGTRVPLHSSASLYPYHSGVYFLYSKLNIPVLPVSHNAGLFWPKNSFVKYPNRLKSKTVTLEISEEIPPGLDKKKFMCKLEKIIEDKTNYLISSEKN